MVVLSRAFLHEHFLFFTYITTLREHPAHQAHLQAASVDKLRRQESLWREDLQSGGNLRTTTHTFSDWMRNKRPPPCSVCYSYLFICRGLDYHEWAVYTDGGTRVVDGETDAGWGVISRSPS